MDLFLALRAIRRFDKIRKRRKKKEKQMTIAIAGSPFEYEKRSCEASKYETKYLASISLINSMKHASSSFSLFFFSSLSLSLWSCYLHVYLMHVDSGIENASMTGSRSERGRERRTKKRGY